MSVWTLADLPDQTGRTIIVTGPTLGGLGHYTALELARRGARVVLAGRTPAKITATADAIRAQIPAADLVPLTLDLASQASIRAAADEAQQLGPIDVLINNAGVMGTKRGKTVDGLETQMATNHFGPFLLTGLLLPQLVASRAGRVVNLASQFHRYAHRQPLDDPRKHRPGNGRWHIYAQTKLANLLFVFELERRLRDAGLPVAAMAAHPGFAGTHLAANGQYGRSSGGIASILDATVKATSQPADLGAWPTLMAATADLPGGSYCGPSGLGEMSGTPQIVTASARAHDASAQRRLWELSEEVTGISFP